MSLSANKTNFMNGLKSDLKKVASDFKTELKTGEDSIYKIHEEIDTTLEPLISTGGTLPINDIKSQMRQVIADKWSEHFGTLLEKYFEVFAEKVVQRVDEYLKTARVQVTIPPGMVTQGASTASAPNPAPLPLTGDPTDPINNGGLS